MKNNDIWILLYFYDPYSQRITMIILIDRVLLSFLVHKWLKDNTKSKFCQLLHTTGGWAFLTVWEIFYPTKLINFK